MRRLRVSLRMRLIVGASAIALLAVVAALLTSYGASETARRIEHSIAAQKRMDLLSALSARVSDYAVIAVESATDGAPETLRIARLTSRAELVAEAFEQVGSALAGAVAESDGEVEQMRSATKSLGLARMRAQFQALRRAVESAQPERNMRVALDGFATQFSPLLSEAIAEERRDRDAAAVGIRELHERLRWATLLAGLAAAALALVYYALLIRPLMAQLRQVSSAADQIGQGVFDVSLPVERRDELGKLFAAINRMAGRLRRRRAEVDADRASLSETIALRTAELSEANERLSRIDAERRRFFADVGHELRTPLTVILAESELGLKEGMEASEALSALAIIRARATRLNRRIDDLLRVARSETGQIELDARPFDLAASAELAVADIAPTARRRGVTLATRFEPAPAVGDGDWCRQVVSGLIENAIRHSPPGSTIEIAARAQDGRALLEVVDEGEGVPEDEVERVFERFARGSREDGGSGFGVGLALARWVLERQSGTISLTSPAPRAPEGGGSGGPGVSGAGVSRPGAIVTLSLPAPEAGVSTAPEARIVAEVEND